MTAADVVVVWRKELRETLRDRRTLAVMVLFPLVVYPVVSLLMVEVMAGKQAADDARTSRVAIVARGGGGGGGGEIDPAALAALRAHLGVAQGAGSRIELMPVGAGAPPSAADVAADRLDALVEVGPRTRAGAPLPVRILYDETRAPSETAHARIEGALGPVLPPGCIHSYAVVSSSTAAKGKVGGYVLSKILPLIVIVMTMLGAFYPAIDITAGERERGTLETLLSSPVRRFDLMTGKVLAVATLAALTGVLNIVSMSLTVAEGARLVGGAQVFTVPWTRAGATLVTVIPAAFLFAAVMVAIGAMARGFKEAQTLLTPVYLLCFTPSLIASVADFRLAGVVLLVPGTNLTLLARDLMLAQATVGHAVIVLGSTLLYGGLALSFAARLYDSERLLATGDSELLSLATWLSHLVGRDGGRGGASGAARAPTAPSAAHAVALFGVAFVLWFFAFTSLQRWRLIPGLLLSQWGGFLGLVWIYARLVRRPLDSVLVLRRPRAWAVVGATLLGLSGWVILGVLADRVMPPPRQLVEDMRRLIRPPGGDRPLALSLFALAITPAICEEALFRGPILRGFRRSFSMPAACLLCGVLFGILHGDIWRFIPTALLGSLLSWVALTSGSIVPSMVVHAVNNGALTVLGYYGFDEATEALSGGAQLAMVGGALVAFVAGVAAVRHGRDRDGVPGGGRLGQPGQSS
ncbi:MAG: ABC transporter permease subunit/CPBP intramembrane protease [Pseudomonadota bacterium]